jgi:hypothetical protein
VHLEKTPGNHDPTITNACSNALKNTVHQPGCNDRAKKLESFNINVLKGKISINCKVCRHSPLNRQSGDDFRQPVLAATEHGTQHQQSQQPGDDRPGVAAVRLAGAVGTRAVPINLRASRILNRASCRGFGAFAAPAPSAFPGKSYAPPSPSPSRSQRAPVLLHRNMTVA